MIGPLYLGLVMFLMLGVGAWLRKNRRAVWIVIGGVSTAGAVMVGVQPSRDTVINSQIPPPASGAAPVTLFLLDADTDFPSLPAYPCASSPAHCYLMDEGSGNLSDSGAGSLTMTAAGTARYAVETGLPTYDGAAVSWTGETAIYSDGSGYFTASDTPPAVASITFVYQAASASADHYLFDWGHTGGAGYAAYITSAGVLTVLADFGTPQSRTVSSYTADDNAWHCVTLSFDGASTAGWIDDTAISWSSGWASYGSTTSSQTAALMASSAGANQLNGGMAWIRLDSSAKTQADHETMCGSLNQVVRSDHPAYADLSWSQTGGTRCFDVGSHRAYCAPGGVAAYYYDTVNADYAWALEQGRVNRILDNQGSAFDCGGANWTCNGTATSTSAQVAPDGSATATAISVSTGINSVSSEYYSGYSVGPVYPRFWLNCSSGTLRLNGNSGFTGQWDIDCSSVGGSWTMIGPESVGGIVAENVQWTSSAVLNRIIFSGATGSVTAKIWQPTLTNTDGLSVIPTGSAAVDTGDIIFGIANATGTYWKAGDTVTSVLNEIVSPCIVLGSTIYLGGDGTPYCTGGLSSLEITR